VKAWKLARLYKTHYFTTPGADSGLAQFVQNEFKKAGDKRIEVSC
jgi:hypothetical protein